MRHLVHIFVFATLLAAYFALLSGKPGKRLKLGLILWAALALGGVLIGVVMAPFS